MDSRIWIMNISICSLYFLSDDREIQNVLTSESHILILQVNSNSSEPAISLFSS